MDVFSPNKQAKTTGSTQLRQKRNRSEPDDRLLRSLTVHRKICEVRCENDFKIGSDMI